nr:hypothetical protein Itr_chr08CG11260 [Ipomoea trifida]GMD27151.1 hypothetical protein Iba_chr08dCG11050 [Ipomoea batatas]
MLDGKREISSSEVLSRVVCQPQNGAGVPEMINCIHPPATLFGWQKSTPRISLSCLPDPSQVGFESRVMGDYPARFGSISHSTGEERRQTESKRNLKLIKRASAVLY